MAIVQEEVKHDSLPVELMVSEKVKGEVRDQWRFVHVDVDGMRNYTPKELCELGRWLAQQGERMGREFNANGSPKTVRV